MPWPPVTHADVTARVDLVESLASPETIRDTIGAALVPGTGIALNVNDVADTITITATGTVAGTSVFGPTMVNAVDFGALGHSRNFFNGSTTNASAVIGGTFSAADVGRIAYVDGGLAGGAMLVGVIQSQTGTTATLNATATATTTGREVQILDDDSAEIQAAINSLPTLGDYGAAYGGTVVIAGQHGLVTGLTLPPGVRLLGVGYKSAYNGFATHVASALIAATRNMTMVANVHSAGAVQEGVQLERINFGGVSNTDRTVTAVRLTNINRWSIRDCSFLGFDTCIYATDGGGAPTNYAGGDNAWWEIQNCTLKDANRGFQSAGTGSAGRINGSDMLGMAVSCIDWKGTGATVFRIEGVKVDHGGSGPAFDLQCYQANIVACSFEMTNVATTAIKVDGLAGSPFVGYGVQIVGCEVYHNTTATAPGILLTASTTDCHVVAASMFNCAISNLGTGNVLINANTRPAITGSRAGNAALASLLSQLASIGLITNNTTA